MFKSQSQKQARDQESANGDEVSFEGTEFFHSFDFVPSHSPGLIISKLFGKPESYVAPPRSHSPLVNWLGRILTVLCQSFTNLLLEFLEHHF